MVITHSPWNHQAVETGWHFHIRLRFLTPGVTFMSVKESDYPPHLTPQHPSWKWSSLVVHLPCTLECFTRSLGSIGCNNIINTHYSASYALCVHHRYHKKDKNIILDKHIITCNNIKNYHPAFQIFIIYVIYSTHKNILGRLPCLLNGWWRSKENLTWIVGKSNVLIFWKSKI